MGAAAIAMGRGSPLRCTFSLAQSVPKQPGCMVMHSTQAGCSTDGRRSQCCLAEISRKIFALPLHHVKLKHGIKSWHKVIEI
jgi:hypothetical protein